LIMTLSILYSVLLISTVGLGLSGHIDATNLERAAMIIGG